MDAARDDKLVSEIVPDQVLPKVLTTFDLIAVYVFIIFAVAGSSIIATGGWGSMPMWALGFVVFLIPAAMAVLELGNAFPAEGGVYVWAYRTMSPFFAFFGGYLSWLPVALVGATFPASFVAFLTLATGIELPLTLRILLQLGLLWVAIGLALRRLRASQTLANAVFLFYCALVVLVFIGGVIVSVRNGGAATPIETSELLSLNFSKNGWIFGLVLLYLVGVETPYNMGAEMQSVRNSATKMVLIGSLVLALGYILATSGILMALPLDSIDPVTGVIGALEPLGVPGLVPIAAVGLGVVMIIQMMVYESAYSRLIFVSGLERHLPRLFTHINPRTRNPVTALLVQGVISSLITIVMFSQQSLETAFLSLQGALTALWLASGYFFLLAPPLARRRYPERYAEPFWRIPAGMIGSIIVALIGAAATTAGIYYTFAIPWSEDIPLQTWLLNVGLICGVTVVAGIALYLTSKRTSGRSSEEELLAQFAATMEQQPDTAD